MTLENRPTIKALAEEIFDLREQAADIGTVIRSKFSLAKEYGYNKTALAMAIAAEAKVRKAKDNKQFELFEKNANDAAEYLQEIRSA